MTPIYAIYSRLTGWLQSESLSNQEVIKDAQQQLDQTYQEDRAKLDEAEALQSRRHQQENIELEKELFESDKQLEQQKVEAERDLERKKRKLEEKLAIYHVKRQLELTSPKKNDEEPEQGSSSVAKPPDPPKPFGETFSRPGSYGNEFGRGFGKNFGKK
jgi:hypothetical protein